jgi:prophage regulatory protein
MSRPACRNCAWRHNQPSMCRRRTVTGIAIRQALLRAISVQSQACQTESRMNSSHKRTHTKNDGTRTPSNVRLGLPAFAVDGQSPRRTARSPRGLDGTSGDEFYSQSERRPTGVNGILEKGTTVRRRSLDEALDALQLLTVTDVCKLLRISKPTLWRLRRSGNFPEPTTVTERIFGWRRSELDAWLESRPSSRRY